jgi:hypothetical protein
LKSDERNLADSDFVDQVLRDADESTDRRHALRVKGWDLGKLAEKAAGIYG